jgi:2-polyprenyl-6-methoxyphenol hydroxylase-like FAD-dependent oxidoreductase
MQNPVVIIGAGLGGLTLARVLHLQGIPAIVYEAEPSSTARAQGGLLDIHDYNGQLALQAAGLIDEFRRHILVGHEALRIVNGDGVVFFDKDDDGKGARPEVMRGDLRQILLDSLPAGTVRWGHQVRQVKALEAGGHGVTFADGTTVTTALLVGADGAWSRVRPMLSDAAPVYTGMSYVETYLFDSDIRHPASAQAVGQGSLLALAPHKGIQAHRERDGTLHTYVALSKSQDWFSAIDFSDPAAAAERIAQQFVGWPPALVALITDSDTPPILRPLFALPSNHRWARVTGVTLLGDAAHLTLPNGEGANLAMLDGAELGGAIAAHPGDIESALSEYEQAMFARSAGVAIEGEQLHQMLFGDDAPHRLVEEFTR